MEAHPLQSAVGYRVRVQSLANARLYNGWLIKANEVECVVELDGEHSPETDTQAHIQVLTPGKLVVGKGTVASTFSDERVYKLTPKEKPSYTYLQRKSCLKLRVDPNVKLIASAEEYRLMCDPITVGLASQGDDFCDTVAVDVSPNGVGVLTTVPWGRGHSVQFMIPTLFGDVNGSGQVRYARNLQEAPPVYRVGINIEAISRLDAQKWDQFVTRLARAA